MRLSAVILLLALPSFALAHSEDYPATAKSVTDMRSLSEPARDHIFSCGDAAMPMPLPRPWVDADGIIDFSKKPQVSGNEHWEGALSIYQGAVSGNALPSHMTGIFPVRSGDAAKYDPNPNSIRAQQLRFQLPLHPEPNETPTCLGKGPIGIMLTGAAIFNALDAQNHDAVATELFDTCEGHPERNGMYHYHHYSPCFDPGAKDKPSPLLGYALDGFGIYGPRGTGGHFITNAELDECHGTTGDVPDGSGGTIKAYHYVLNNEFPYSLGCYRGTPIPMQPSPGSQVRGGPRMEMPPPRHPPDLRMVAQKLGVTEEELRDALGPPPPDLNQAARKLGINVQDLREALGPPPQE